MEKRKLSFIQNALRRASYKWPGRFMADKNFKGPARNQYICAMCPEGVYHPKKNTQMDHIIPVVDPEKGFTTLDEWADRLFVETDGWQRLCLEHHEQKTLEENKNRVVPRRIRKTKKKAKEVIQEAEDLIEIFDKQTKKSRKK